MAETENIRDDNKLLPDEIAAIQISLQGTIEDLEEGLKNPMFPFTPDARADMRDIIKNSKSALQKLQKLTGRVLKMDPYQPGDEEPFITKES